MTIPEIKALCQQVIKLGEKATPGPWKKSSVKLPRKTFRKGDFPIVPPVGNTGPTCIAWKAGNGRFIAAARSFTPQAAKALLLTITALESQYDRLPVINADAKAALNEICKLFPQPAENTH